MSGRETASRIMQAVCIMLLGLVLCLPGNLAARGDVHFEVVKTHPGEVFEIETADVDGDGQIDIVYSGSFNCNLHIMYGRNGGGFDEPVEYPYCAKLYAFGYLNDDKYLDIAGSGIRAHMIFLNNGDRTFTVDSLSHDQVNLGGVALGYFNDDSYPDILTTLQGGYTGAILYGDGQGGILSTQTLPFVVFSSQVGDFNGDYIDDAVVFTSGGTGSVMINDGYGNFTKTAEFQMGGVTFSTSVTQPIADFNRDGYADFAFIASQDKKADYFPSKIFIGYGDGSGGLLDSLSISIEYSCYGLAVADFNRDRILDLAASNVNLNRLEIFEGLESGGFAEPYNVDLDLDNYMISVASADFDRNGSPDLVSGAYYYWNDDSIMVVLNSNSNYNILDKPMITTGYSNVRISIENPEGFEAMRDYRTIAGANFERFDADNDNSLDERISDRNAEYGEYKIKLVAKPTAVPDDIFSADMVFGTETFHLFKDHPVPPVTTAGDGSKTFEEYIFPYFLSENSPVVPASGSTSGDQPTLRWNGLDFGAGFDQTYHLQVDRYFDFRAPLADVDDIGDTEYQVPFSLETDMVYYWRVSAFDGAVWSPYSGPFAFYAVSFVCGDVNDDSEINILDILDLVNYKFKDGPAPDKMVAADVNSDGKVNILDIVILISYKFKQGPEPNCQ